MDQVKTGKFISQLRKELKLTQRELAEKLNISDKTISKWETGKGFPEISLMLPLCEILGINVNELLSGERLSASDYHERAEENMMKLIKEKEESKKKIILSSIVIFITIVAVIALILISELLEIKAATRIGIVAVAYVVLILGIAAACVLDRDAGVYECRKCGEKFVPDMKAYIMGPHTITTRYLKCPKCGKSSYCKHRLSR